MPSATDHPNPQSFPCVNSDTFFRFALVPTRKAYGVMMDKAQDWLIKGLEENGAGAKTAAGYGWFDLTEFRLARERELNQRKQEDAKRRAEEVRPRLQQYNVEYLEPAKRTDAEKLLSEVSADLEMRRYVAPEIDQVRSKIRRSEETDAKKEKEAKKLQEQAEKERSRKEQVARHDENKETIPPRKEIFANAQDFLVSELRWFAKPDYSLDRKKQLLEWLVSNECPTPVRDGWNMVKSGDKQQIRQLTDTAGNPLPREVWRGIAASVSAIREFATTQHKELP